MKRIIIILLLFSSVIFARKIVVKMGTLAPEGTDWHGMLIEMGQQWKSATKGKVQLRIYPGGVLGDERDMVRKMRIGQIQAAGMTAEGLSEIVSDFSCYFVPLVYQDSEDVNKVTEALLPELEQKLDFIQSLRSMRAAPSMATIVANIPKLGRPDSSSEVSSTVSVPELSDA